MEVVSAVSERRICETADGLFIGLPSRMSFDAYSPLKIAHTRSASTVDVNSNTPSVHRSKRSSPDRKERLEIVIPLIESVATQAL